MIAALACRIQAAELRLSSHFYMDLPVSQQVYPPQCSDLHSMEQAIPCCKRCPDLVSYTSDVGHTRKRAYRDFEYWAKPVPSFGDHRAKLMIVGLAPGAHGANRTGRMFTGDRSGDFLYAALHRVGLASQAESIDRHDGLRLKGVYITAALHCAPPGNKPRADQLANCRPYLAAEFHILQPIVIFCLGGIAWKATLTMLREEGVKIPKPQPRFGHGAEVECETVTVIGSYHVSQQNTFTGRLTEPMLDEVLLRAICHCEIAAG